MRLTRNYILFSELTLATDRSFLQVDTLIKGHLDLPDFIMEIAKSYNRENDLSIKLEEMNVKISSFHLKKIIEELIDNAIKFSKANSKISVNGFKEGIYYNLVVEDLGRGMNPGEIQKVASFVQFERNKMEQAGLGLGLSLVKKILSIFHGEFQMESEKGKGTKTIAKIQVYEDLNV